MRPGIRHVAGSTVGNWGFDDGFPRDVLFNAPLGIALSADQDLLYVADYGNRAIRSVNVSDGYTNTVLTLDSHRPKHLSVSPDGTKVLMTADAVAYQGADAIIEAVIDLGTYEVFESTAGKLGDLAYQPDDDGTAVVRVHIDESPGWHTFHLSGADRGILQEPPSIPDPPFCDPPTNSIPVTVRYVRDNWMGDVGVTYVGSIVVAHKRWHNDGYGAITAFDPWSSATPAFPGPYVTCDPNEDAPVEVVFPFYDMFHPDNGPRQLSDGPTNGTLPTVIGALWEDSAGLLVRVTVDVNTPGQELIADFDLSLGLTRMPVGAAAYSSVHDRLFFSTTGTFDNWNQAGEYNGVAFNQIVELTYVSDPPIYSGGSGVMPIRSTQT